MISSITIIQPTPRSTLFPYTTLFRSDRELISPRKEARLQLLQENLKSKKVPVLQDMVILNPQLSEVEVDRKSTRLNSSHVKISYAVFCLKKKKQPIKYINNQLDKSQI